MIKTIIPYLVITMSLVQLIGISIYIKDIIRGNTKPNMVTWLLWSAAPIIGSIAAFSSGARWATLPVFMSGFGPLLVFVFALFNRKSYWKLENFDYVCGAFSVLALIFWAITKQPLIAIIFAIISDLLAAIPTLKKSFSNPETESTAPYVTGLLSSIAAILAVKIWTSTEFLFPLYLVTINIFLLLTASGLAKKIFRTI